MLLHLKPLTLRQQQVYTFICTMVKEKGFPPTCAEIQKFLGAKSLNSAVSHIAILKLKGFISVTPKISRGISIVDSVKNENRLETYWSLIRNDLESWTIEESLLFIDELYKLQINWVKEKFDL